ncbi:MAG: hypothetical protein JW966_13170 [Anaerolineae bacterium]|nr:hypothetical protein [Anaerolineae bacterium]
MRKYALHLATLILGLTLAACQDDQPPTQVYIVISPTPETVASDATGSAVSGETPASPQPTADTAASITPSPGPTEAPDIFPTATVAEVQIAEQVFENGRMFWIRHTLQIWVMQNTEGDPNSGDWFCYNDPFQEGEVEMDPAIIPPEGLYQPRRGFGKLWRNTPGLRDSLGFATTPEFELTSSYTYLPGGYVQDNQYFAGPGEHRLTTLYDDSISFFEGEIRGDCQGGTWSMTPTN